MAGEEFKVSNNSVRSLPMFNYTISAKLHQVVTDGNITYLDTNEGEFCAKNVDLGGAEGIHGLVEVLKGNDRDIRVEVENGHETTTFVKRRDRKRVAPVEVEIRVPSVGGGNREEFIGVLRKDSLLK